MRQVIARASCGTLKAYLNNKVVVVVGKERKGPQHHITICHTVHTHLHYSRPLEAILEADGCLIGSILKKKRKKETRDYELEIKIQVDD